MTTPAFVALGDIHLARLIWTKQQQITGDSFAGFSGFIDQAIRLRIPAVIVGDLFDVSNPDSALVEFFRHEMDRAQQAGVEVFAIQGNHDKRTIPWYCAASPWPIHIGDGRIDGVAGLKVTGFDYALKDEIEARLADLTGSQFRPDVLFLHQAVKQALKFEGAWNCDLDWVPEGIPLIIMGDIHKPMEFVTRTGAKAYYTGASHARDIEQLGPKSCLLVNRDLTVERLPIPYRHMRRFWITWGQDLTALQRDIRTFISLPPASELPSVLFLTHTPDMAETVKELVSNVQAAGTCIVVTDEVSQSSPKSEEAAQAERESIPTRPQIMSRILDPERDRLEFQLALDLLEPTSNLQETIRNQRDRFMLTRRTRIAPNPPSGS